MENEDGYTAEFDSDIQAMVNGDWSPKRVQRLKAVAKKLAETNPEEAVERIMRAYTLQIFHKPFSRKTLKDAFSKMIKYEMEDASEIYSRLEKLEKRKMLLEGFAFYRSLAAQAYFESDQQHTIEKIIEKGKKHWIFDRYYSAEDFTKQMLEKNYKNLSQAISAIEEDETEPLIAAFG